MIAVSINTQPSIIIVKSLPAISGWRAEASDAFLTVRAIPIAPTAATRATTIVAVTAFATITSFAFVSFTIAGSLSSLPAAKDLVGIN